MACSSFINCIKTAARALSLDARKSRLIRNAGGVDVSPLPSTSSDFSTVQRIDFFFLCPVFLSLGALMKLFSFSLPKLEAS